MVSEELHRAVVRDATAVFVQFDGVHMVRIVELNGTPVCGRPYGFSSFECDIAAGVKLGFSATNGFTLNGAPVKLNGTCNHHDLGALGAAINTRAIEDVCYER